MANKPAVTKSDVVRSIETERAWWRAVVDLAAGNSPVTGDEPVNGDWTYRELIGHVNGWRRWTVARLEAAAAGGNAITPWPGSMSGVTEAGLDEINAYFQRESREIPLDEAIAEMFSLLDRMRMAVESIPDDRLLTPGAFARTDPELADYPIGPALVGFSITHVHIEHAPALQTWLSERIGQHAELPPAPSSLGYEE